MNSKTLSLAAIGLISLSTSVMAVPLEYGNPTFPNPVTYTFIATATGPVTAYFVGESAAYGSMVGLSVNGTAPLSYGLQNHIGGSTPYGTSFNMGNVAAGDLLRFVLAVDPQDYNGPADPFNPAYFLNSDASLNPNGENHVYASLYGGDATIPSGIYVGFEDISPLANGDSDYNDHQFVFTNVRGSSNVPDGGATIAMLGLAISGLSLLRRKS